MIRFTILVTDTSPLITLALADALDLLLRPGLPVRIPDAVYFEATRVRAAPGASRLVAWIAANTDVVAIVPTETGLDQAARMEAKRPIRGLGERAALDVLDSLLHQHAEDRALLLFEDTDVERKRAIVGDRVVLLSTGDYLRELQRAGIIQSAEHVLDTAADQGRNVERLRRLRDAEAAALLRGHLADD